MRHTTIALLFIGLASPALAQGLDPALEGEGSQTQSLDLVGGAVSVSVQSSGSASLGRGDDALDGDLGVTINDLSITTAQPGGKAPSDIAGGIATGNTPKVGTAGGVAASSTINCDPMLASPDELAMALGQDFDVLLREVACDRAAPNLEQLIAAQPEFFRMLTRAGLPPDRLISITIHNGAVILDHAKSI